VKQDRDGGVTIQELLQTIEKNRAFIKGFVENTYIRLAFSIIPYLREGRVSI